MAILPLSLSLSLTSALSATSSGTDRPVARLLHPRVPSRPTVICLVAPPKVPLPIASPASLVDDPSKWDPAECDALLRGGEQVASVLQEMLKLMEDMEMDGSFEPLVVELVAQGVIGKRVDEMEPGFLMALDYMIQLAQKDSDNEVLEKLISHFAKNDVNSFIIFEG